MTYKKVILKDIALFNQQTYNKKYNWEYAYYLDTGSITENNISQLVYYDLKSDELPSRARRIPKKNSILYSTVRPNQKHFGFLKDIQNNLIVSTGFAVIDVDSTKVDPKYVYYYLIQQKIIDYLQSIAEGSVSTYPTIKPKVLKELEIIIPDKSIQYKVVNILSSLDHKIEVNNKIIANLEEQAQAIFKSWFVDFDPFQNEEFIESELGMIPKGWEVISIGDIAKISSGKRPNKKIKVKKYPIIGANGQTGWNEDYLYDEKIILIGRVGTLGNVQRLNGKVWPSDNTLVFTSKYYNYLYQILKNINYYSFNRGSTQPLIAQKDIKNIKIIWPKLDIIYKFDHIISRFFDIIWSLHQQNQTLSELRDVLLPKLMSGEIDVSQISVEDEVDES